jgi:pilus assembly protein CpaF
MSAGQRLAPGFSRPRAAEGWGVVPLAGVAGQVSWAVTRANGACSFRLGWEGQGSAATAGRTMMGAGFGRRADHSKVERDHPIRGAFEPSPRLLTRDLLSVPLGTARLSVPVGTSRQREVVEDQPPPPAPVERMALVEEGNAKDNIKDFYHAKSVVASRLYESIDLARLSQIEAGEARRELKYVCETILHEQAISLNKLRRERLLDQICDDVLGLGPLEPLLARDDISDIMVNTAERVYIEVNGRTQLTTIRFRDNDQLANVCQRIVAAIGRRVDEAAPICDARLADGSRVNIVFPPVARHGPSLTIRRFKRDRLTLEKLVTLGSLSPQCATVLRIAAASRCNILVTGATGSGKTTLLNCLTKYFAEEERIITCEDVAELQLQQCHVVSLEARPPNVEGCGEITMRELVRSCLRMRPERIVVGEVRGPEAFDLLSALNTGHNGSMGTVHANNPRDALSRLENMVAMCGFNFPSKVVREQIASGVDLVVHVERLKDGLRRVTQISEVVSVEDNIILMQDVMRYHLVKIGPSGELIGEFRSAGMRPRFYEKAQYYDLELELMAAINEAFVKAPAD